MILTVIIFVLAYIFIATEKFPRHWVALIGGGLLIVFGILSPKEAFGYINWETLGLLAGMFTLVSILEEAGFFKWLAMRALKKFDYHPVSLFVILIVFAAIMSMFMDSITVMLFLSALTLQLGRLLKLDPVPLVIAEVCAANTGGSATLVGDPPNVILGTTLGFNFTDFATHTGPISLIASLLLLGMFYLTNRKALKNAHDLLNEETINEIEELHKEPMHAHMTRIGLTFFAFAVFLLIFHTPLSRALGFHINAAMAALIPAALALIFMQNNDRKKTLLKVDGESILFFAGLFVLIGGLEKMQLFEQLAISLSNWAADDHGAMVMALHWVPGLASGIVDNVPLALGMSYVLKDLAQMPGAPALALMVWSLALGVNLGGNLTPIGASANVVAYSFMEKNHGSIGWKRWLTVAVPPTLAIMIFASLNVLFKGQIGWF
ncbi:MAG: anion permease [Anaerolineales bacterium]|nr:anion permease [Anaerolineales bacterium]